MKNKALLKQITTIFAFLIALSACEEIKTTDSEEENEKGSTIEANTDGQMLHLSIGGKNLNFERAIAGYKTTALSSQGNDSAFFREEVKYVTENAECRIQFIAPVQRSKFAPDNQPQEYFKPFTDNDRLKLLQNVAPKFPIDISQHQSGVAVKLILQSEDEEKVYTSYKSDMFGNSKFFTKEYLQNANFTFDNIANTTPGKITINGRFKLTLNRYFADSIPEGDFIQIDNAMFKTHL